MANDALRIPTLLYVKAALGMRLFILGVHKRHLQRLLHPQELAKRGSEFVSCLKGSGRRQLQTGGSIGPRASRRPCTSCITSSGKYLRMIFSFVFTKRRPVNRAEVIQTYSKQAFGIRVAGARFLQQTQSIFLPLTKRCDSFSQEVRNETEELYCEKGWLHLALHERCQRENLKEQELSAAERCFFKARQLSLSTRKGNASPRTFLGMAEVHRRKRQWQQASDWLSLRY